MKKITLLIASTLFSLGVYAQQTLSHSVDQTPDGSGVACRSNPDQIPQTGDEGISDNIFYRAYTPADFGFSGDFDAMGISFIVIFSDNGGSDPLVTNTVRLFTSDESFPNGTLTELASQEFDVRSSDDGAQFDVMFENPVTVSATTELIVAVDISAAPAPPDNYDFAIAQNDLGQDDFSYISSDACSLTTPAPFASIGFPDNHIILNLIGDANLSTDDFSLSQVSVYPNPASDNININMPSNIEIKKVTIFDALGRIALETSNTNINVSELSRGTYFIQIETPNGDLNRKIVIE